ncbi:MAG: ATP synthase alpha/beta family, beta-barrel domain protein, partial [Mycobacterium sp.]
MAELTISADDIQGAIEEYVSSFTSDTTKEEVGT